MKFPKLSRYLYIQMYMKITSILFITVYIHLYIMNVNFIYKRNKYYNDAMNQHRVRKSKSPESYSLNGVARYTLSQLQETRASDAISSVTRLSSDTLPSVICKSITYYDIKAPRLHRWNQPRTQWKPAEHHCLNVLTYTTRRYSWVAGK